MRNTKTLKRNLSILSLGLLSIISLTFSLSTNKVEASELLYRGPGAYDVSTAVHAGLGEELDISGQEAAPTGIRFSNDGMKLFAIGNDGAIEEYALVTAFDISTATYSVGEELDISTEETLPTGFAFSDDGLKMFVVGTTDDSVVEYTLGVAFDVSIAVPAGAPEEFVVSGQDLTPEDLAFSSDGLTLFILGSTDGAIAEYALGAAFDVSTAVYAGAGEEFTISTQEATPTGFTFNAYGTKMFLVGSGDDAIAEYNLRDAFDISTASYVGATGEFSVTTEESIPTGVIFNNDGTKVYVIGTSGDRVVEYAISQGTYSEHGANDGSINNDIFLLTITLDGDTFQDTDADNLLDVGTEVTIANVPAGLTAVVTLSETDTKATLTFTGTATNHQDANDIANLTFVFDDTAFTGNDAALVDNSGDAGAYSSNVGINFADLAPGLTYYGPTTYDISIAAHAGVPEEFSVNSEDSQPNGMTFNNDGTKMYVIGALNDNVYEYDLATAYDVSIAVYAGIEESLNIFDQEGTPTDLAFGNYGSKLFIIGVNRDTVIEYTLEVPYDVSTGIYAGLAEEFTVADAAPKSMGFNNDGTKMYVTGLVNNAILEYSLGVAFDVSTLVYAGLAEKLDLSNEDATSNSFSFNYDGTKLFYTGSSTDTIYLYNLGTAFDVSTGVYSGISLDVSSEDNSPSDAFFNHNGTKLFLNGNQSDSFIEYTIAPGNYPESASNNGSTNNTSPLVIALTQDTFQDTDADNLLDVGTEVTIGNVPAGLTPVLTLSESDTRATLTFTGTATVHHDANDVADLTFIFDDTAFTNGDASVVTDSGDAGAFTTDVGIDFEDNDVDVEFSANYSDLERIGGNLPVLLINGVVTNATTVEVSDALTGTATSGTDYTFTSPQTIVIPAGAYDGTAGTSIAIPTLTITNDQLVESSETIILSLSDTSGDAIIADADVDATTKSEYTYQITNDDPEATTSGSGIDDPFFPSTPEVGSDIIDNSCSHPFTDVNDHWSKDYITQLFCSQIVSGRDETHFAPEDFATRAEVSKIALAIAGIEVDISLIPTFPDIEKEHWAYHIVGTAEAEGIIDGYEDGTFKTDQKITRAEALKILLFAKNITIETDYSQNFPDVPQDLWAISIINYAYGIEIVEGYEDGTFRPHQNIKRGEIAKLAAIVQGM